MPPTEGLVYLVRHGGLVLPAGSDKRFVGQVDLPLSAEGRRYAELLADWLGDKGIRHIVCSDLSRSRKTAAVVAERLGVMAEVRRDLREIGLGEWEGLTFGEVQRRFPEEYRRRGEEIVSYRPPGGESFADCARRAVRAFAEITHSRTGPLLIVGHAGVNRSLIAHILGMPLANLFRLAQPYGCLSEIVCRSGAYRLMAMTTSLERQALLRP
jgi:broad specificity phosphatase PhoE